MNFDVGEDGMSSDEVKIGNIHAIAVSDATEVVKMGEVFPGVPAESWKPYRRIYPQLFEGPTDWNLDHACYLLRSEGRTILVDTGIGPATSPLCAFYQVKGGRLLEKLLSLGVHREEVDIVVLTHLHPDHIGWNTLDEGGERRLTFPRARYLVHQADWKTFSSQPEAISSLFPYPFLGELVAPLQAQGKLDLVSAETSVTSEIRLIHTPGHTPGSLSVLVSSGEEGAIIWGDVTAHPAQMAEPDWDFLFDMDIETARETRRQLLDRVEQEGMVVAAAHVRGFGRLVRAVGRRCWDALQDSGGSL